MTVLKRKREAFGEESDHDDDCDGLVSASNGKGKGKAQTPTSANNNLLVAQARQRTRITGEAKHSVLENETVRELFMGQLNVEVQRKAMMAKLAMEQQTAPDEALGNKMNNNSPQPNSDSTAPSPSSASSSASKSPSQPKAQSLLSRFFTSVKSAVERTNKVSSAPSSKSPIMDTKNEDKYCRDCLRNSNYTNVVASVTSCTFCQHSFCAKCVGECMKCEGQFCGSCSTTTYDTHYTKVMCLDCIHK
ncbi:hypothetical protein GQ42DRAFT_82561 [Ramicandelaber brevisporus]|nr:hypothetical protein GQ42DRAFT_82561 [Ramicandelaber brevisporus]